MYLQNRLVAMLDVLGFASRIQDGESLQATTAQYAQLIQNARTKVFNPQAVSGSPGIPDPNFEFGQFVFDTIVLVSRPIDVKSVCNFVSATSQLMEDFFLAGFPLRGAIGKGDFCVEESVPIFLSDSFKRLKTYEDMQQWSGCAVLPEAEGIVASSLLGPVAPPQLRGAPLHRIAVPRKDTFQDDPRWCLNWAYFLAPEILRTGIQLMAGDSAKQINTQKYLDFLAALEDDSHPLESTFLPATRFKVMASRGSCRIKFEDDSGAAVDPACEFSFQVIQQVDPSGTTTQ